MSELLFVKKPKTKRPKKLKPPRPRFRYRGSYAPLSYAVRTTSNEWGGHNVQYPQPGDGKVESMRDVVLPDWRERKASTDGYVMNPMTKWSNEFEAEGSGFYCYETALPDRGWERYVGNPMPLFYNVCRTNFDAASLEVIPKNDQEDLINEVSTKVLSERNRSNVNFWENYAEKSKTLEMLRHPIKSFLDFDKKNRVKAIAMAPAAAWMMYRYGIRPLVADIMQVIENRKLASMPPRFTTRAKGEISKTLTTTENKDYGILRCAMLETQKQTLTVRAMSLDEAMGEFSWKYGMSAKQLMTLPWELIPKSFVVDWFINIGDFIGAYADSLLTYRNLGACIVSTRETLRRWEILSSSMTSGWGTYTISQWPQGFSQCITVVKTRVPGLRAPALVVKSNFKLDQITRQADALAMIAQVVSKIPAPSRVR